MFERDSILELHPAFLFWRDRVVFERDSVLGLHPPLYLSDSVTVFYGCTSSLCLSLTVF